MALIEVGDFISLRAGVGCFRPVDSPSLNRDGDEDIHIRDRALAIV